MKNFLGRRIAASLIISLSFFVPILSSSLNDDDANKLVFPNSTNSLDTDYLSKFSENEYILGPGDKLSIIISESYPELTRSVRIDGGGTIVLGTLGRVYVEGLTLDELRSLLDDAYKEYVKYRDIQISVTNYRPINILVDGEVNEPGILILNGALSVTRNESQLSSELSNKSTDTTANYEELVLQPTNSNFYFPKVFDAIQKSGGVTEFSDLKSIKLIRRNSISNGGGKIETTLDLQKFLLNRDNSHNIRIYDQDTIVVQKLKEPNTNNILSAVKYRLNPKYVTVAVEGRVNAPGVKKLSRRSTLNDAIDISGGTKLFKGKISYLSFNNDGSIEKRKITYRKKNKKGSYSNPFLKEGDLILVGSSLLNLSSEAITEITNPFQGLYSAYRLIELIGE